jgi:uncharacterized membrane protein YqjE
MSSSYDNQSTAGDGESATSGQSRPLGDVVGEIAKDLESLVRQELQLAKTEAKQEATKAGKGVGLLGAAGVAGYLALLFLSVFLMFVLADWFDSLTWSALVITALWTVIAAVLAMSGKKTLKKANPKLETTQRTLKEDVQWAKEQKSS